MTVIFREGFEDGEWTHDVKVFPVDADPYETEIGNIFTPKGWLFWFKHDPDTWDQPEAKHCWRVADPNRIKEGNGAHMFFSFWRHHDAGYMRQVQVGPGTKLRLTVWAHAWSNTSLEGHEDCCDDGRCSCGVGREVVAIAAEDIPDLNGDPWNDALGNSMFAIGIDPHGGEDPYSPNVIWGKAFAIYNGYCQELVVEAEAVSGTVTVFMRNITLWKFKHNDAYWDEVRLESIDGTPPPYESTMLVLPQDATTEQLEEIFGLAYPQRRTFGFSHDDAGNLNGTAILYNIPDSEKQAYLDFYAARYPGVVVEFAYTSDWVDPPSGLLLWQCDPKWKDEEIADPNCSKTLCQVGCWVADAAMAQRYYGIKSDATPSTANQALGSVGGFSGCETTWAGMKAGLGLEVMKRSTDKHEVREWLDTDNICFGEVEPETYMHFVMVTRYQEGRFWMLDPYKNVEGWVDEHYPGIESWRLIRPFDTTPPPPIGNPIGLHLQSMSAGWGTYVQNAEPNVTKVLASMHDVAGVKRIQPDALVVWRHVDNDYGGIIDNPDSHEGARRWIAKFKDSLYNRCDELAQIPGITKPYFHVEPVNEVYPSHNAAGVTRAVNLDMAHIEEIHALDLPLKAVVFTAGIGNPHESEYELLVPLARKAEEYGALMGYHGYFWVDHGVSHLESDWQWHAGRWMEMDKVFVQHGIHVKWFGAEGGAHYSCAEGWRAPSCLNGNWEAYLALLLEWKAKIDKWNAGHGNRYLGQVLFTTGGHGWASWEIQAPEMESLASVL